MHLVTVTGDQSKLNPALWKNQRECLPFNKSRSGVLAEFPGHLVERAERGETRAKGESVDWAEWSPDPPETMEQFLCSLSLDKRSLKKKNKHLDQIMSECPLDSNP